MDAILKRKQKKHRYKVSIYFMIIAAYVIVEILSHMGLISSLLKGLLVPFCTYSILAVSLNLVVGISGELSLGHAGFMCIGAFSSAIFTRYMKFLGMEGLYLFIIAILIGALTAGIAGLIIGIPVLRLKGDYLAIVTLAFGEIIKNIVISTFGTFGFFFPLLIVFSLVIFMTNNHFIASAKTYAIIIFYFSFICFFTNLVKGGLTYEEDLTVLIEQDLQLSK